jgi:hypothetical protein
MQQDQYDETLGGGARTIFGWRALATLAAVASIASAGMLATRAALADQVTMGQITVAGGTLDMVANGDTGDSGVAWVGSLSVALSGMAPGDEQSGTVEIENTGDLPFTLTGSTSGTDASGCFSYYLRETAVTAGSGASTCPVNLTGMGTAAGADGTTADFATDVTGSDLPDAGADLEWEAGDAKE